MSSHFQRKGLATQDMEVQVMDGLTGIVAAVGNHPVTVFQAFGGCDLRDHGENMGDHIGIFSGNLGNGGNMSLGDHQNVGGGLGGNVPEGQDLSSS